MFFKIVPLMVCFLTPLLLTGLSSNPKYFTPSEQYHIVKPGDTLKSISRDYSIPVEQLKIFNSLSDEKIFLGQKIYLSPRPSLYREYVTVRSIPRSKYHLVKPRETIHRIAKMYDLSIFEVIEYNNLTTYQLQPGQKIWLEPGHLTQAPTPEPKTPKPTVAPPPQEKIARFNTPPKVKRDQQIHLPVNGDVTSEFGNRNGRIHKGIDIAAPKGTPIHAALEGKVVYAGVQRGYGNVIILEHVDYIMTVYAHNETNLVRLGDKVNRAQPIATVGSSGTSDGPHLHFEYRVNGQAIDPREVLPDF